MKKSPHILIFIGLSNISLLFASETQDTFLPDTTHFEEVVIKASRIDALTRNIPGSVQLLSKENIQIVENSNLSDAINKVPGVYMQSGAFQTSRLTIRGIGSRNPYGSGRIRSFYNDIPMSSGDGSTILEDVDPVFIGKAEVVKGPNSAWYGAGLGGALRLYSPENLPKTTVNVLSSYASYDTYKAGVLIQSTKMNIGVLRSASDGYRQNSEYYKNEVLLSGSLPFRIKIDYIFHMSDIKGQIPSSVDENTFRTNPKAAAPNWLKVQGYKNYYRILAGMGMENEFSENLKNKFTISGSLNNAYELRPFNILDDDSRSIFLQEQLKLSFLKSTLLIGTELQYENYNWQILKNITLKESQKALEKRLQSNSYLHYQRKFNSGLLISASVNVNKSNYSIKDRYSADSINYSGTAKGAYIFSPSIGISLPLFQNFTFYSSFGHGFSNPTVEESVNSQGFLNNKLRPEQGWGLGAGARIWLQQRSFWFDVSYYHIWLQDLLVTKRLSEEVFYGDNAGSSVLKGIELSFNIKPFKLFSTQLSFQKSMNRFEDFIDDDRDFSGKALPGIPSYTFWNDWQFQYAACKLNIVLNANGRQYLNDENGKSASGWKTVDIKFSFSKKLLRKAHFEFQTGIKNLFNEHYASMILVNAPSLNGLSPRYYYPAMPLNFFLNLKIDF